MAKTTTLQSIAMVMAWWIMIPVLVLSHRRHRRSCWREYRADPVGDQWKEEAALRRGGGGNHGQVVSVTSDNRLSI